MIPLMRGDGRFLSKALALALGIWVFSGLSAQSDDGVLVDPGQLGHVGSGFGTLGWGPPGYYPGFYGFGLSFHRGYGYGGDALGAGAEGGYPFYGGPGYLHPAPPLQRFGHIIPFAYFSGPGYPFNFVLPGELVVTQPVVEQTMGRDLAHEAGAPAYPYNVGFGPFTGALPYPESYFAPYTAAAASGELSAGVPAPSPSATVNPNRVRDLGIDEQPVVDVDGVRGMKVSTVYPGTAAEKAGLKPGDVIRSINGYRTEQPGNLAWIIVNAAHDKVPEDQCAHRSRRQRAHNHGPAPLIRVVFEPCPAQVLHRDVSRDGPFRSEGVLRTWPNCRLIGTGGFVSSRGPGGVPSMHGRASMKLRPGLERLEGKQLLSASALPTHVVNHKAGAAASALHTADSSSAPGAKSDNPKNHASLALAADHRRPQPLPHSFLGYRLTNPTKLNVDLIPPFGQVLVQARQPVPGHVYNVLSVAVKNGTSQTFTASNGFTVKFPNRSPSKPVPILTGTQQWEPGHWIVFYVLTKKYYPLDSQISGGFQFDLGGRSTTLVPGPSAIFLRLKYKPATFARTLDWIVAFGQGRTVGRWPANWHRYHKYQQDRRRKNPQD